MCIYRGRLNAVALTSAGPSVNTLSRPDPVFVVTFVVVIHKPLAQKFGAIHTLAKPTEKDDLPGLQLLNIFKEGCFGYVVATKIDMKWCCSVVCEIKLGG